MADDYADRMQALLKDTEHRWLAPVMSSYTPQWCQHVVGFFGIRDTDSPVPEQRWRACCLKCGGDTRGVCITGAVANHITHFAAQHLHRNPLDHTWRHP